MLDFTGWLPYRTREEFAEYRADHPELEPFTLYDFDALDQCRDEEAEKGVLPPGFFDSLRHIKVFEAGSNLTYVLAGMAGESK